MNKLLATIQDINGMVRDQRLVMHERPAYKRVPYARADLYLNKLTTKEYLRRTESKIQHDYSINIERLIRNTFKFSV